jgi:malonate transporter
MTLILLNALLPIFVGLLLGYWAGRRGVMDMNVHNLVVLVMDFAIPCDLFATIIKTSWPMLAEQAGTVLVITVVFAALYAGSYVWGRRSLKMSVSDASVLALTVGFPNSAAVALPLLTTAYGPRAAVPAALSIAVGAVTTSPMTVALLEADKLSAGKGVSISVVAVKFLRAFTRPVVLAPVLALLGVYFGWRSFRLGTHSNRSRRFVPKILLAEERALGHGRHSRNSTATGSCPDSALWHESRRNS